MKQEATQQGSYEPVKQALREGPEPVTQVNRNVNLIYSKCFTDTDMKVQGAK